MDEFDLDRCQNPYGTLTIRQLKALLVGRAKDNPSIKIGGGKKDELKLIDYWKMIKGKDQIELIQSHRLLLSLINHILHLW